jgi:DNA-binding HxlR family transcriptional regulator
MERKSFETMPCSIAQTLEIVGEWWSMLIVRDVMLGFRRFDQFQERLGISRNVLAQRLAKLVAAEVLDKRAYQDNPPRYDYVLTEKGRDLWPALTALRQWGDKWAAPGGPPVVVEHRGCGARAPLVLVCAKCGEQVGPRDVEVHRQAHGRADDKSALKRAGANSTLLAKPLPARHNEREISKTPRSERRGARSVRKSPRKAVAAVR